MGGISMPKTLITLRASEETIRKIEDLVKMWGSGTTKSEIMTIAIDRLYRDEAAKEAKDKKDVSS